MVTEALKEQRVRVQSDDGVAQNYGKNLCSGPHWLQLYPDAKISQLRDPLHEMKAPIKSRYK